MIFSKAFYNYRQDNIYSSINSKEKANCIIEEFSFIENKINETKLNNQSIMNIFYRTKYFHYLYNFYRISPSLRKTFLKTFTKEFKNIQPSTLNLSIYEEKQFNLIINNPDEFLILNEDKNLENYKTIPSTDNKLKKLFTTIKEDGLKGLFKKIKIRLYRK